MFSLTYIVIHLRSYKMIKVASLRYGVIFKKAFSPPHIFNAFVQDILGIQFNTDSVETEKSFSPSIGKVDSHFDLFAEDKKHRIIVDIQHARHTDHYHRFLHYHCVALLEQIANSHNYHPELIVYTIVILTSGDRHKVDIAEIDFDPKDRYGKGLGEIKHKIIYICPKYVSDDTPIAYQDWLRAIDDSLDEEVNEKDYQRSEIQEIFECIQSDHTTPQEYARMKAEYSNNELLKNKYEKGIEKGMKKVALNLIKKGVDLDVVAEVSDVSIEQVTQWQEEIQ